MHTHTWFGLPHCSAGHSTDALSLYTLHSAVDVGSLGLAGTCVTDRCSHTDLFSHTPVQMRVRVVRFVGV